jgi:hypothetical protein
MGGPSEPTRAAKRFRVVVLLGSAAICVSVLLPWCKISGFTYTLLAVDSWKVFPFTELVVAIGSAGAALIFLSKIKRIGLFLGAMTVVLNAVGAFVAAHLANVHNSDPYYRIWAVLSVRPAWGAFVAWLAAIVLIVGGLSRWAVRVSVRTTVGGSGKSLYSESLMNDVLHGIPRQPFAAED